MKYVVEAGTDAATLLLFDPRALPEHFDAQIRCDPTEMLEDLAATGRICWISPAADGNYLLHVCLEEEVSPSLQPYLSLSLVVDEFLLPSGRLYFTGVEYGFRDDDTALRKHPHMGSFFVVPPGKYRLTLYETNYPDEFEDDLLRKQATVSEYRLWKSMGWLVILAVLSLIGLGATAWRAPRLIWYLGPVWGLLILLPVIAARLGPFRRILVRHRALQREFPAYIARLEFLSQS